MKTNKPVLLTPAARVLKSLELHPKLLLTELPSGESYEAHERFYDNSHCPNGRAVTHWIHDRHRDGRARESSRILWGWGVPPHQDRGGVLRHLSDVREEPQWFLLGEY